MARRGSGGLQNNPLADMLDEEEREETAAVAAAQAAGAVVQDLPVRSVAPDPDNPQSRLVPDQDLTNSIKSEGQLSAGAVVPLDVWIGYGNDPATLYAHRAAFDGVDENDKAAYSRAIARAKDEIQYVINWGHRRWAGCIDAGKATYKALVTDTVPDKTTSRIHRLIENVHRSNLTPLEEADEFNNLINQDKVSQREITRRTGIPQPYISKRVSLRRLPAAAQQALADKAITVELATELAKMTDDPARIDDVITRVITIPVDGKTDDERQRQTEQRNRFALDEMRRERASYDAAKERAALRKKLRAEGVTVVDDLADHFGDKMRDRHNYQLHGDDAITAAREAGTAFAYVYSRDQIEWYTTEEPADPQPAEANDSPDPTPAGNGTTDTIPAPRTGTTAAPPTAKESDAQRHQREERERNQREKSVADDARAAACQRIASKAPNRDQLTERLARRVMLCEATFNHAAQQLAATWLTNPGLIKAETPLHVLFGDSHGLDGKTHARVAYVYDLALDEAHVRDNEEMDIQGGEHIERLIKEAGYTPSQWEQQRLDALNVTSS